MKTLESLAITAINANEFNTVNSSAIKQKKYREILLKETFKPGFKCVEVGVFMGDFSEIILTYKPKKLFLIDSWASSATSGDTIYAAELGKCHQTDFDKWETDVRERFKDDKRVEIIKNYSVDAAKQFKDKSLDWIYIDAAHHYEAVLKDLNAWIPKVKMGGYLCGDDFLINGIHRYGVIEAVHEFLNLNKFKTKAIINHKEYGKLKYKCIGFQFYIYRIPNKSL